jgi:hypothetical protein
MSWLLGEIPWPRLWRRLRPSSSGDWAHGAQARCGLRKAACPFAATEASYLVLRRHGTVLAGTSPGSVAADAGADQGRVPPFQMSGFRGHVKQPGAHCGVVPYCPPSPRWASRVDALAPPWRLPELNSASLAVPQRKGWPPMVMLTLFVWLVGVVPIGMLVGCCLGAPPYRGNETRPAPGSQQPPLVP